MLHALAQGGCIRHERGRGGRILEAWCFTRDGAALAEFSLETFAKLRRKRLVESRGSQPYRISETGRRRVRAQPDNR